MAGINATKTKLLSINHHPESRLIPLKMSDIELPRVLVSIFMDLFLHPSGLETCPVCLRHHKVLSLFPSQRYFTPEIIQHHPALCGVLLPYLGWCSRSGSLDLFDTVQRRLLNLIAPFIVVNFAASFSQKSCRGEMFPGTVISGSP